MIQTLVIVAGGNLAKIDSAIIARADFIIGVDYGAYWLVAHGISPHVALGDFDSVSPSQFTRIRKQSAKVLKYPATKDKTDLELAIDEAIGHRPAEVIIYGVIGSRLDHTLVATILLERLLQAQIPARIIDEHNELFLLDKAMTLSSSQHTYLSIVPQTATARVTMTGVKYPVVKKIFHRTTTTGISNDLVGEGIIRVHEGVVLVVRSKDR